MVVYTKSGVTVNCCGNLFIASDGKTYNLCGRMLTCSGKVISYNCQSKDEALGTVVGLYGGRTYNGNWRTKKAMQGCICNKYGGCFWYSRNNTKLNETRRGYKKRRMKSG